MSNSTDSANCTEVGDENVEQQHPGLHTPPGSGEQRNLSGRDVEADKNVTMPSGSRKELPENSGPTAPANVEKDEVQTDNRKGGYGAG